MRCNNSFKDQFLRSSGLLPLTLGDLGSILAPFPLSPLAYAESPCSGGATGWGLNSNPQDATSAAEDP